MKRLIHLFFILLITNGYAWCGGDYDTSYVFYNLFKQTNISDASFYPFLRDPDVRFYGDTGYDDASTGVSYEGNIALWQTVLTDWDKEEIRNAVYGFDTFNWSTKTTPLAAQAKKYVAFANLCSDAFSYRNRRHTWDYDALLDEPTIAFEDLLIKANELLKSEKNEQLRARYHYQIIRVLHYAGRWQEAIDYFTNKVADAPTKNEVYYYTLDQVAGCYYSVKDYEKAAYLFTKVLNHSVDRKKSAFNSFSFCAEQGAQGISYFKGLADEKDLLLMTSLRTFTDEIKNINSFIALDANDPRVELLFMRALNNLEQEVLPKSAGSSDKKLPAPSKQNSTQALLQIADAQSKRNNIIRNDFWKLASSYLSFIQQDLKTARVKLESVSSFPEQKKALGIIYTVFGWETITAENENFIAAVLKDYPMQNGWPVMDENDLRLLVLDKVAHTYYKNGKLAKAFLVHNKVEAINNLNSLPLLDALEVFYNKLDKTSYEQSLLASWAAPEQFLSYIHYQRGVFYLHDKNPKLALQEFSKNTNYDTEKLLPSTLFSNNIKECFSCPVNEVMVDEVYKASVFSFIKPNFSRKELASYLLELEALRTSEKGWVQKLANYLLGNYYFNISNTGYYRGALVGDGNCCDYNYVSYASDTYTKRKIGADLIANTQGYNLDDVNFLKKFYYNFAGTASSYYQEVISLSKDKELNARSTYMLAKCELNHFYANGSDETFTVILNRYYKNELPMSTAFKQLKTDYSDTEFYEMILKECSYFKLYTGL